MGKGVLLKHASILPAILMSYTVNLSLYHYTGLPRSIQICENHVIDYDGYTVNMPSFTDLVTFVKIT